MPTREALALAREQDLDLVEVAPNSVPPVCRLLDYGKFRYLQSTKEREMRKGQKAHGLREVRFRPKIGKHDIEFKGRLVRRLLGEGNKVKVSVMFRGREIAHPELAVNLLRQVHDGLKDESKLEQAPNLEGRFMSIILAPVRAAGKQAEPAAVEKPAKAAAKQPAPSAAAELAEASVEQAEPTALEEPVKASVEQAEPSALEEPAKASVEQAEPSAVEEPAKATVNKAAKKTAPSAAPKPARATAKKAAPVGVAGKSADAEDKDA